MSREKPILVTPTAANEDFTTWLSARFTEPESAHRITVVQVGVGNRHGETVFTYDQRPEAASDGKKATKGGKPRPTREALLALSNKILAAVQLDCDVTRCKLYMALAWNPAVGPDSYSRFPLRLAPKNAYTELPGIAGDDEEGAVLPHKLLMGLLANSERNARWAIEAALNVASGAVEAANARIEKMEIMLDGRLEKETRFIAATEDALSRASKRKIDEEWAQMKVAGVRDIVDTLKGLLPSGAALLSSGRVGVDPAIAQFMGSLTRAQIAALVGSDSLDAPKGGILSLEQAHILRRVDRGETALVGTLFSSLTPQQHDQLRRMLTQNQLMVIAQIAGGLERANDEGANGAAPPPAATEPATAEQLIITKFFAAVKADKNAQEIDLKLFGDWKKDDGGELVNATPGILLPEQFMVLAKVFNGRLPASALDDLVPGSGKPLALTDKQQEEARAIMPAAAAAAIMELFTTRAMARSAATGGADEVDV